MMRKTALLLLFVILASALFGCGLSDDEISETVMVTEDPVQMPTVSSDLMPTDASEQILTEPPIEMTEPVMQGQYSLEQCKGKTGIFIAHADGSFTKYYGGGYLDMNSMRNATGMYIENYIVDRNPTISKSDQLVVFCDTSYGIEMLPVSWDVGVLFRDLGNGTYGYTRAMKHKYGVDFFTYYDNHETVEESILYIDGIPAEEYSFVTVQGGPKNTTGSGFPKGTTVRLGIQNGSTLVEEEYKVDATYYDCELKRNTGGVSDDQYYLHPTPTTDGYAIIDIYDELHDREVPSGTYVLVFSVGRSYIAYLLKWQNA